MRENRKIKVFLLSLLFFVFLGVASFAFALEVQYPQVPGTETALTFLPNFVKYVFNFLLGAAGLAVFAVLIYSGIRYLISADNPAVAKEVRTRIFSAILGLIILFSSYLILNTVSPQMVMFHVPFLLEAPWAPTMPTDTTVKEKPVLSATKIPIGALVDGTGYSKYAGFLGQDRMALIKEVLDEVKSVSIKIVAYSKELAPLAAECNGMNTRCTYDPMGKSTLCECDGEPCPNRSKIDALRLKINALNAALDVFIKGDERTTYTDLETGELIAAGRNWKIRDFIKDFPPNDVITKSLGRGQMEMDACIYQASQACYGVRGCDTTVLIRSCLLSTLGAQAGGTLLSDELRKDLEEMAKIEEKGGELEDIKRAMEKDLARLEEGENLMKDCFGVRDSNLYLLFDSGSFRNYKETLTTKTGLIKDIDAKEAWDDVVTQSDPATFYCSQELVGVLLKGEVSLKDIQAATDAIEKGGGVKLAYTSEVPVGQVIDDAVTLAKKIIAAITELLKHTAAQTESTYALTNLTNWETMHCGKSWRLGVPGNNQRGCPFLGCLNTGGPCEAVQTCPMTDINNALISLKKNIACLLKKKGDLGITGSAGEQWLCCGMPPYPDYSCKPNEGPYGRLLRYYTESQGILKRLAEVRKKLSECGVPTADWTEAVVQDKILREGLLDCGKFKLNLLEENLISPNALSQKLNSCTDADDLKAGLSSCDSELFYFSGKDACQKGYFCCDMFNYFCYRTE